MSAPTSCIEVTDMVDDWWNTRSIEERSRLLIDFGCFSSEMAHYPFITLPLKIQTEIVEYWANR